MHTANSKCCLTETAFPCRAPRRDSPFAVTAVRLVHKHCRVGKITADLSGLMAGVCPASCSLPVSPQPKHLQPRSRPKRAQGKPGCHGAPCTRMPAGRWSPQPQAQPCNILPAMQTQLRHTQWSLLGQKSQSQAWCLAARCQKAAVMGQQQECTFQGLQLACSSWRAAAG